MSHSCRDDGSSRRGDAINTLCPVCWLNQAIISDNQTGTDSFPLSFRAAGSPLAAQFVVTLRTRQFLDEQPSPVLLLPPTSVRNLCTTLFLMLLLLVFVELAACAAYKCIRVFS